MEKIARPITDARRLLFSTIALSAVDQLRAIPTVARPLLDAVVA